VFLFLCAENVVRIRWFADESNLPVSFFMHSIRQKQPLPVLVCSPAADLFPFLYCSDDWNGAILAFHLLPFS
jgi:hypothetical protein